MTADHRHRFHFLREVSEGIGQCTKYFSEGDSVFQISQGIGFQFIGNFQPYFDNIHNRFHKLLLDRR